jgi:hypothetical protein
LKAKFILHLSVTAMPILFGLSGHAQGTFQNLDFESANLPNGTQPGPVLVANALPGWSVYYGTNQVNQIFYNDISLGAPQVTLLSANDPFGPNAIEGNFGVLLQGGSSLTGVSIRQNGLVPVTAESILFKASSAGPMTLSLGGQAIPLVILGTGPNFTLYGGNIPITLAGQVEQLAFSVPNGVGGNNAWNLDSIVFSPSLIPEPGALQILALGGSLLLLGARRQKSNQHPG